MKTLGKFSGKPISSKETGGKDTNVFMGSCYTKSHIYHVKPSFLPVVSHGQNFFPSFILISPICWKLICSVSVGLWTFLFCLHLWRTVLFDTEFLFDSIPSYTVGMSLLPPGASDDNSLVVPMWCPPLCNESLFSCCFQGISFGIWPSTVWPGWLRGRPIGS